MIKATVAILTFNSENNLNNCLLSVKSFKEILILDGGSTDKTLKIAKKYKCKILEQPKKFKYNNNKIKNFSKLKNFILKKSSNNLILFLDSDEILNKSILKKINFFSTSKIYENKYYSFLLGRFPIYKKKIIKQNTLLYPNFQERLIYKSNVKCFIKSVHERPIKKYNDLVTKKIEDISIKFPINDDYNILYKKYQHYYNIEKRMLIESSNFLKNFRFVCYKLLVIQKYFFKNFISNSNNYDKNFKKYELENLRLNTYFSLKLLKSIFKKN